MVRKIAARPAYGYSAEDASMNRSVSVKGYVMETGKNCWRFELTRSGRPFHKSELAATQLNVLERQRDNDANVANAAFKTILDSFVLRK